MFVIRKIKERDYEATVKLIEKTLDVSNAKDYPPHIITNLKTYYSLSNFPERVKDMKACYVVIEKNYNENNKEKIVGVGGWKLDNGPQASSVPVPLLTTIFVHPDYQKRNIGTLIVSTLENDIKDEGFSIIELHASITSQEFYSKMNYEPLSLLSQRDFGDAYLMRKRL